MSFGLTSCQLLVSFLGSDETITPGETQPTITLTAESQDINYWDKDARFLDITVSPARGLAVLHYTTDGSEPSTSSPEVPATGVRITQDCTVKVQAFDASGIAEGEAASEDFKPRYIFRATKDDNSGYEVKARLAAIGPGDIAEVFVEDSEKANANVTDAIAEKLAADFETKSYDLVFDDFADPGDVDGDGHIALLLLEIESSASSSSFTAGYFDSTNALEGEDSNYADMLYIDCVQGDLESDDLPLTITHELQHMANYNHEYIQSTAAAKSEEDSWINEGLSAAAEQQYQERYGSDGKKQLADRVVYFYDQKAVESGTTVSDTIRTGQAFVSWDAHEGGSAVLASYSTVYLFFQWLRVQSPDGAAVFKDIIAADAYDAQAVVAATEDWASTDIATQKADLGANKPTWEYLIRSWYLANFLNDPTSVYGYKGDAELAVSQPLLDAQTSATAYKLLPGEGLFGKVSAAFSPVTGVDIAYARIDGAKKITIGATTFAAGDCILAYNPSYLVSDTPVVATTGSFSTMAEIRQLPPSRAIGQSWEGHRFRIDWIRPPKRGGM
ncbi:MAG: chitobiase/beta-hexosaminidase C-terminal domain-containing protein [Rectinemataceae bacterium]